MKKTILSLFVFLSAINTYAFVPFFTRCINHARVFSPDRMCEFVKSTERNAENKIVGYCAGCIRDPLPDELCIYDYASSSMIADIIETDFTEIMNTYHANGYFCEIIRNHPRTGKYVIGLYVKKAETEKLWYYPGAMPSFYFEALDANRSYYFWETKCDMELFPKLHDSDYSSRPGNCDALRNMNNEWLIWDTAASKPVAHIVRDAFERLINEFLIPNGITYDFQYIYNGLADWQIGLYIPKSQLDKPVFFNNWF